MKRAQVTGIETAAVKAAVPAAKGLARAWQWLEQRLAADHMPIGRFTTNYGSAERIILIAAVAPSDTPPALSTSAFVTAAQRVAGLVFEGLSPITDYSGREVVWFKVRDSHDPNVSDQHTLEIYPNGLMLLRWGLVLSLAPEPDNVPPIPMGEFVRVLRRLYDVAHLPEFQQLHGRRRWESKRRLDLAVSLTTTLNTTRGTMQITELDTLQGGGFGRAVRHAINSPLGGYAGMPLKAVKPSVPFEALLREVLDDLAANSGFTDPQGAMEALMRTHEAEWNPMHPTIPAQLEAEEQAV